MKNNSTIIILGATGDLATKNLIPALYELYTENPDTHFSLIGVAHNSITPSELKDKVRRYITQFDQNKWDLFIKKSYFLTADIEDPQSYTALSELISRLEAGQLCNRIIYCACPPQLYIPIATNCVEHKIIEKQDEKNAVPWYKIIFEKPFGTDTQTAQDLNNALKKILSDDQIIRADHYLAKELVETVAYLRFTNEIFEPLWNSEHIEYVLITLKETVTVEERASLYDSLGVVRDVIQSHALQLLSLVAMEAPLTLEGQQLHSEKIAVLKKTTITNAIFGQYLSFAGHKGVKPRSTTPTYALITCKIDTPRWHKTPFLIQAGKGLDKQTTQITVVFKQPVCRLSTGCPIYHNELTIKIAPRSEFSLSVNIKMPQNSNEIMPINLNFCYSCMWPYTPQAYRVIFENILQNIGSISVPFSEIEQTWKIVDPIIKEHYKDINFYEIGSSGPVQATDYNHHLTDKMTL